MKQLVKIYLSSGVLLMVTLLMLVLNITGLISISWWWVALPILAPVTLFLLLLVVCLVIAVGISFAYKQRKRIE